MHYSLTKLGFMKTAKLGLGKHFKLLQPPSYKITTPSDYAKRAVTPSGSPLLSNTRSIMPQSSKTLNYLADAYKAYRDKVVHIPINRKKHQGTLSLGNIFNQNPRDPNTIKGFRYTWSI